MLERLTIIKKSVLGVLSEKKRQQQAIDAIYKVLKPKGVLLMAENLEGSKMHQWLRKKYVNWNTYWRYLQLEKDQDLFQKFAYKKFQTNGFFATLGRTEKQRTFLSFWDDINQWWIPKKWQYVIFGVLKKQ